MFYVFKIFFSMCSFIFKNNFVAYAESLYFIMLILICNQLL